MCSLPLLHILKSSFDGNRIMLDSFVKNPSLFLLDQYNQMVDEIIGINYRAIRDYEQTLNHHMPSKVSAIG